MIIYIFLAFALTVQLTNGIAIFAKEGSTAELQCPKYPVSTWSGLEQGKVVVYTNYNHVDPRLNGKLSSTDHGRNLYIHNFTGNDVKNYRCTTTNGSHMDNFEFNVKLTHKPKLLVQNDNFTFSVDIGIPVNISIKAAGYPIITVSWTMGCGGVEGDWVVVTDSRDFASHTLQSSVLIHDISQLGPYKARIRNTEGTLDVTFILQINKEINILTFPKQLLCNATKSVKLICYLPVESSIASRDLVWNHYHGGVFIRRLDSINNFTPSEMEIKYCNYQDVGEYVCSLSKDHRISASSFLRVYGSPVVTEQDVLMEEDNITLIVKFISNPDIMVVKWFLNQQNIHTRKHSGRKVESATIELSYYGIVTKSPGYVAKLIVTREDIEHLQAIDCLLQNNAGTRESSFTYKSIYETFQSKQTQKTDSINATNFNHTGGGAEPLSHTSNLYIHLLIALISTSLLFCLAFVARKIVAKLRKTKRKGMQKGQHDPKTLRESVNVPEVAVPARAQGESENEETDNVPYDSVTWRDYALHSDKSQETQNATLSASKEQGAQEYINVNLYESLKQRPEDENKYDEFPLLL